MTSRISKQLQAVGRTTIVVASMLVLASTLAVRAQAEEPGSDDALQGTWRVAVTLVNCATGVPMGPPFTSLLSFVRGGTLVGTTSNPGFQPGQRSSEHGIWKHTGWHNYAAVHEAFILFTTAPNPPAPGFAAGTQRITEAIQVDDDQSTSAASIQFFDTGGNLVRTGCARTVGSRFEF